MAKLKLFLVFLVLLYGAYAEEIIKGKDVWSVGHLFGATVAAVLFPGEALMIVLHDLIGVGINLPFILAVSLLFWFFPVARVRQWAGINNPFAETKAYRLLLRTARAAHDKIESLRSFGRNTNRGGWA